MGLNIPPSEAEALAEHFTEDGENVQPPAIINYRAFCATIDECFGVLKGLESNPTQYVPRPGDNVPPAFTPNPVENTEQLDHVLHRLALMCRARGVAFKYCYQDYERGDAAALTVPRRGGKITLDQFKRSFPFVKEFDPLDVDILIDHYLTRDNLVHYGRLDEDIAEILARVVERRLRLAEHFQDYDPLRKGFCEHGQVKAVFNLLKIHLEIDEFNELFQMYEGGLREGEHLFCYAAFCAEVDSAFTTNYLEKQPLARIGLTDATTTIHARRNFVNLTPEQASAIEKLEAGIQARIRTRRILVRPDFARFDSAHRGHVTKGQFARVMNGLGFQMDAAAIDLLGLKYADLGNHTDFNYVDFYKSCDPPSAEDAEAMMQENAPYQAHKPSKYFDIRGRIQPLGQFSANH